MSSILDSREKIIGPIHYGYRQIKLFSDTSNFFVGVGIEQCSDESKLDLTIIHVSCTVHFARFQYATAVYL